MISHILKKDWKLLWPMVALITAIQAGHEWAVYSAGLFGENAAASALLRPLTLAWFIGIAALVAAVIHQDPVPGVDQDWLIRPIRRTELLLAKLAFMALTISVPMLVLDFAHALALGMLFALSLKAIVIKELFVMACFIVPVAALAATTRNMTELIVVGAALTLIFALSLSLSALFLGADWCPTCHTGTSWLQHLLQHIGVLVGAGVIIGLQYYRRRTALTRALAALGAASLVFVQLSWGSAFVIEQWLTRPSMTGADTAALEAVALEPGLEPPVVDGAAGVGADARQASRLLLRGRVDQAFDYLRRRARPGNAPVTLDVPVRTLGVAADELLLVDRSQIQVFGGEGRLLHRAAYAGASAQLLAAYPGDATISGSTYETLEIPGKIYGQAAGAGGSLQVEYYLTLAKIRAQHRIAALDGELRSADIGLCATALDRNAIYLRCKSVWQSPFCYSATLYDSQGHHNPEVFKCVPDYRPYWPALIEPLSFYGVDLPVRDRYGVAQYAVDPAALGTSFIVLKIFGERAHFKRSFAVAPLPPRDR